MNRYQAKKLAQYHEFTKIELFNILKEALEKLPENYWSKPNKINPIFDNGYYFNQCRKWIDYKQNINENDICNKSIVIRILEGFGKYSKVQLPKKKKLTIKIQGSEYPKL